MTSEGIDPETALFRELADIKEFKKEVRSLKTRLGRLTRRVDQLQLISFQGQLNGLDKQITKLSDELLQTRRQAFNLALTVVRDLANKHLHGTGHVPPFPPDWQQACEKCSIELQGYYLEALENVKHCQDAEAMKAALNSFLDKVNRAFARRGFAYKIRMQ
jgi:hypothetical protein